MSASFILYSLGEQAELAGEVAAEQQIVVAADHAGVGAVGDFDLDVRRAAGGRRHGVRLDHLARVDVQRRRLARIVSHHRHRVVRLPETWIAQLPSLVCAKRRSRYGDSGPSGPCSLVGQVQCEA